MISPSSLVLNQKESKPSILLLSVVLILALSSIMFSSCANSGNEKEKSSTEEIKEYGTTINHYEIIEGYKKVGEEKVTRRSPNERGLPSERICEIDRIFGEHTVSCRYTLKVLTRRSKPPEEILSPYSDFVKDPDLSESNDEVHIRIEEDYEDCPVFEPHVAGLVEALCAFVGSTHEQATFSAIVPSLGSEKRNITVEIYREEPPFIYYITIMPENTQVIATVDPLSGELLQMSVPSMNLEFRKIGDVEKNI